MPPTVAEAGLRNESHLVGCALKFTGCVHLDQARGRGLIGLSPYEVAKALRVCLRISSAAGTGVHVSHNVM